MRPAGRGARASASAPTCAPHEPARGNPEKLQRVLFNLIQNAIRHTPADGSVTVRAEASDGRVEIEVADTGEGIGADDRARVFEPFYRGGAVGADARRRRPRPRDLARDRRGARRAHLAGRLAERHARALLAAARR